MLLDRLCGMLIHPGGRALVKEDNLAVNESRTVISRERASHGWIPRVTSRTARCNSAWHTRIIHAHAIRNHKPLKSVQQLSGRDNRIAKHVSSFSPSYSSYWIRTIVHEMSGVEILVYFSIHFNLQIFISNFSSQNGNWNICKNIGIKFDRRYLVCFRIPLESFSFRDNT